MKTIDPAQMSTQKTAPDFGEPWDFDGGNWITDSHNAEILNLDSIHSKNAERLIACVNACAGMSDPAAEIQVLREAVKEARDILNDLTSYPVECGYVDGPCLKREDMDAVQAALSKLQSLA